MICFTSSEVILVVHVVILAGGAGERFWPLSRQEKPKQFLPLFGELTMLQQTVARVTGLVEPGFIYVVTGEQYREQVMLQLPQIPHENIICEPFGRDTAPAIGLAAEFIYRRDREGTMVVLPADHCINDIEKFHKCLKGAIDVAAGGEWVVTIGIQPSEPATGFGYIRIGDTRFENPETLICHAVEFREKPALEQAQRYLEEGNYLWNSGMFIWRVDLVKQLMQQFLPDVASGLEVIGRSLGTPNQAQVLRSEYQRFPRISVDYGIMEKCRQVLVIPADFDWDDVGSWTSWEKHHAADENCNVHQGRGVLLDTCNCMVYSPKRVVATVGVKDLLIIDSADGLLICHRDRVQDVKEVVEALRETGYEDVV
jgi:mannose-1-phosphate guanylyltransferase